MSSSSNKYAEKVFSEHPVAIWPLDDEAYYISLIDESQRNFSNWSLTNCSISESPELPDLPSPFNGQDNYYEIIGDASELGPISSSIELRLSDAFIFNSLNEELKSFSINFYIYQKSVYVESYEFGFKYFDNVLDEYKEVLKTVPPFTEGAWLKINETFDTPEFDADQCELILKINTYPGGETNDYNFIIHGFSIGQWSETFSSTSLGSIKSLIPSESGLNSVYGIQSKQYGPLSDDSYHIIENGKLLSKTDGIPMVFGSLNSIKIYPSENNLPSFIFPGQGFLSNSGKNKTQTLEFWLKIKPNTKKDIRILGPIESNDGIYVSGSFIVLSVDGNFQSYNVQEWYRPMLIHFIYNETNCQLYINGEQVIELPINRRTISLSENQWIAFFGNEEIDIFEIDCISIMPYAIPLQVAKRRFVWGQGVESQEIIDDSFKGISTAISLSNAEYSSNIIYPDKERWSAGYLNNIASTNKSLVMPNYSLPEIFLSEASQDIWYEYNRVVNNSEYPLGDHPKFITFRPNINLRTNLIVNPSFEINTNTWKAESECVIQRETSIYKFGGSSVKITNTSNSADKGMILDEVNENRIVVQGGDTYTFSAWVKRGQNANARVKAQSFTTAQGFTVHETYESEEYTDLSDGEWHRTKITFTVSGEDIYYLSLGIELNYGPSTGIVYADGILLELSSEILPYFDGSFYDEEIKPISYKWIDEPNASESAITYWSRNGTEWNGKSYLEFSTANIASAPVSAIYGVFEIEENVEYDRPLIHIVNTLTNKRFEININSYNIFYIYDGEILETANIFNEQHIVVGFHIPTITENFGSELLSFFSSYDVLQIYVGGCPDTVSKQYETFEGKIYRIGFSDSTNYNLISQHFQENGIVNYEDDSLFIEHYATYTVSPFERYNKFFLDISIYSQWEEYFPLSALSDYVFDSNGNFSYDIDYLQFNIGYSSYIEKQIENNEIILDTSNSPLQIFATFQLIAEGSNEPLSSFIYTKKLNNRMTVDAQLENTEEDQFKAYKTKYSLIDGTIIYPPKNIKTDQVSLNIHFVINSEAILSHPLFIRDMSISSKALNTSQPNQIGTKFGKSIYPYIKRGIYFDYKSKNPFFIYNKNTPYLYLTEKSGIKLLTSDSAENEHLISIPLNEFRQQEKYVAAAQLFIKYDSEYSDDQTVFEILYKQSTIKFVTELDSSSSRIKIIAKDKFTNEVYSNIIYFQNGIEANNVIIEKNYWYAIGFVFPEPLDLDEFNGAINLFSKTFFNNISYYSPEGLNQILSVINRNWQNILTEDNINNFSWKYWYDENSAPLINIWKNLYILLQQKKYSLVVSDIYKNYTGTNSKIVDDDTGLTISNDDFYVVSNVLWSSIVEKPA